MHSTFPLSRLYSTAARSLLVLSLAATALGCEDADADAGPDASLPTPDGGTAVVDASRPDTGVYAPSDAGYVFDTGIGAPSDGGVDSAVPDAGTDAGAPAASLCKLKGSEIALIGDSYIHITGFGGVLAERARKAGALATGEGYVDHALSGASMDGFPNIPSQWPDVVADAKGRGSKIRLTIMTGGGNDVLVNNRYCLDFPTQADISAQCKNVVATALKRGQELVDKAAADGLEHVIYFFYPHLSKGSIGGGPHSNTILDYALPEVRKFCEGQTKVPCTFVDLVPAFDDGQGFARDGLIQIDGIHPTTGPNSGTELMADVIWKVMQDNCLGSQKP